MFILSCESTVDVPYSYVQSRNIPVIEYSYIVNGQEYPDDMGRNPDSMPNFYALLRAGNIPKTSQLSTGAYMDFFDTLLQTGDVLHLAFGSGMTQSVNNALIAANELREKYPNRRITVIDTTCSSSGYGLLVDSAADLRDAGQSMEQVEAFVQAQRRNVHHQFFSTTLSYYRQSGRMSGPAAMIGNLLNICPIMRLDRDGHIIAYGKVRTIKAAIQRTLDEMEAHAVNGRDYAGKCWICHSDCMDVARQVQAALRERFPHISGDIRINDIGTIIASHCGPGTLAVFFYGDERPDMGREG